MARLVRNAALDSRTGRGKLKPRREPFWMKISKGCHLGYRRVDSQRGTWIARYRPINSSTLGKRKYRALGEADDILDADGKRILSFKDAQKAAEAFFKTADQEDGEGEDPHPRGALTVSQAVEEYLEHRVAHGAKAVDSDRLNLNAHVLPALGNVRVDQLTHRQLERWQRQLALAPARLRSAKGEQAFRAEPEDEEERLDEKRARRATANRIWASFRACLTHAAVKHGVSDDAWRRIRPFKQVARARVRWLTREEATRLVNASQGNFRNLVTAGLLTGARYGELGRLTCEDFNGSTLFIRESKGGKPRHIALTDEARAFFARLTRGRSAKALLLTQDGRPWKRSNQEKPMDAACIAARIEEASFHTLRHTFASWLVQQGVPLAMVATQTGHSSIAMIERHYGHLAPSHTADVVRAAFGELGVLEPDNVRSLKVSG
jgi:integrase